MCSEMRPSRPTDLPFEPDEHGYCYRHQRDFDSFVTEVSRRLLESRLPFGKWTPLVVWAAIVVVYLYVYFLVGWPPVGYSLVFAAYGIWELTRARRLRRKVVAMRRCFKCGYPLLGAPTGDDGWGCCSECGARFNVAYYRRPDASYRREIDTYVPARRFEEMVHPLDRARMGERLEDPKG